MVAQTNPKTLEEILGRTVRNENECLVWMGGKSLDGYALIWDMGKQHRGHRLVYQLAKGDIPPRMTVDHICWQRDCINPDHLQLLTASENAARQWSVLARTHCRRGHEFTPENIYRWSGRRLCRTCKLANTSRSYFKRKAAAS